MEEANFKVNDIVFGRFRDKTFWPGRVTKILPEYQIYQITFFNHQSVVYLQLKDLIPFSNQQVNAQKKSLISQIRQSRIQNKMRAQLYRAIQLARQEEQSNMLREQCMNLINHLQSEDQSQKIVVQPQENRQKQLTLDVVFQAMRKRINDMTIIRNQRKIHKFNEEQFPQEVWKPIQSQNQQRVCIEEKQQLVQSPSQFQNFTLVALKDQPSPLQQLEPTKQNILKDQDYLQQPKVQQQKQANVLIQQISRQPSVENTLRIQPKVEILVSIQSQVKIAKELIQVVQLSKHEPALQNNIPLQKNQNIQQIANNIQTIDLDRGPQPLKVDKQVIQLQAQMKGPNDDFDVESMLDQMVYPPIVNSLPIEITINQDSDDNPVQVNQQQHISALQKHEKNQIQQQLISLSSQKVEQNSVRSNLSEGIKQSLKDNEQNAIPALENQPINQVQQEQKQDKEQFHESNKQQSNAIVDSNLIQQNLQSNDQSVNIVQDGSKQESSLINHPDIKEPQQLQPQQEQVNVEASFEQKNIFSYEYQVQQKQRKAQIIQQQIQVINTQMIRPSNNYDQIQQRPSECSHNHQQQRLSSSMKMELQQAIEPPILSNQNTIPQQIIQNKQKIEQEPIENPIYQILKRPFAKQENIQDQIIQPKNYFDLVSGLSSVQLKLQRIHQDQLLKLFARYVHKIVEYLNEKTQRKQLLLSMAQRQIFMAILSSNMLNSVCLEQAGILQQLRQLIDLHERRMKKGRSIYHAQYLMVKARLRYFEYQLGQIKNKVINMNRINSVRVMI